MPTHPLLRWTLALMCLLALSGSQPSPPLRESPANMARLPIGSIVGEYSIPGSRSTISVESLHDEFYELRSNEGWRGVGILDGAGYSGVFRYGNDAAPKMRGLTGRHAIIWTDAEAPRVLVQFDGDARDAVHLTWSRTAAAEAPFRGNPGEYDTDQVDELPVAILKRDPVYPESARERHIQGTVMLNALIRSNGTVGEIRVVRSIPELDVAAIACLRQWTFKPALAHEKAVAVWVAIPVKFSLP